MAPLTIDAPRPTHCGLSGVRHGTIRLTTDRVYVNCSLVQTAEAGCGPPPLPPNTGGGGRAAAKRTPGRETACLATASTAAALGRRVLVVESSDRVGGTTAISGGMIWIPANHKMAEAGIADGVDAARNYLRATVPGFDTSRAMAAFLARGDEALRFLEANTALRLQTDQVPGRDETASDRKIRRCNASAGMAETVRLSMASPQRVNREVKCEQ